MTKKHYEKAATIVAKLPRGNAEQKRTAETVCECFVQLFTDDNPRFDASRFRTACS